MRSEEQEEAPANPLDEEYFDEFDKFGSEEDDVGDSMVGEFDDFGSEEDNDKVNEDTNKD